jgi:hypothetical protein
VDNTNTAAPGPSDRAAGRPKGVWSSELQSTGGAGGVLVLAITGYCLVFCSVGYSARCSLVAARTQSRTRALLAAHGVEGGGPCFGSWSCGLQWTAEANNPNNGIWGLGIGLGLGSAASCCQLQVTLQATSCRGLARAPRCWMVVVVRNWLLWGAQITTRHQAAAEATPRGSGWFLV